MTPGAPEGITGDQWRTRRGRNEHAERDGADTWTGIGVKERERHRVSIAAVRPPSSVRRTSKSASAAITF
jgi:ferric-dicitrate binding protein FerR (iron transport regulator)